MNESEDGGDDVSQLTALEQYGAYDFAKDDVYLQGLASIIAGGALRDAPDYVREEILRRTRVFYFNNLASDASSSGPDAASSTNEPSVATSSTPASTSSATNGASATTADPPRTLTFVELQALIEAGRVDEIPNNREIPDKLNDAPPSQSIAAPRKKPWEVVEAV
ncbi:uncharacterized protein SCHCODRAFT_02505178 [Schizophyllum commune H4-8]|uniref:Uncharacterized protein n=1 Tax=Schizophyllum commune (strain H4-8 / FGSC 9210) TaxID=578458 RepID=D8Q8E2_SCHCM|nr:uncharacterized protein SCHCODRAFT_02505178 [Schizophyllum commune H4-8]KAI5891085.1 hypothetical protein SCHCODRAFT_02505178 [Schizophyllum commune H4-8]